MIVPMPGEESDGPPRQLTHDDVVARLPIGRLHGHPLRAMQEAVEPGTPDDPNLRSRLEVGEAKNGGGLSGGRSDIGHGPRLSAGMPSRLGSATGWGLWDHPTDPWGQPCGYVEDVVDDAALEPAELDPPDKLEPDDPDPDDPDAPEDPADELVSAPDFDPLPLDDPDPPGSLESPAPVGPADPAEPPAFEPAALESLR